MGEPNHNSAGHSSLVRMRYFSPQNIFLYTAYGLCALLFTVIYWKMTQEYGRATLQSLTDFKAETPFQYRILVPCIARAILVIVPLKLTHTYFVLTVGFTFGLFVAYRRYLALFMPDRLAIGYSLGMLYVLLWNYCALNDWYYPTDIPGILFFVIGLILIYKQKWWSYYPLFIIATLNRETSFFLTFAYLFTMFGKHRFRALTFHVAAQSAIWIAIKYVLTAAFINNPGSKVCEILIYNNVRYLQGMLRLELWPLSAILTFGFVWLLIPVGWKQQPVFLKRMLLVCVPFLIGMSIVGNIPEARRYCEMIPILLTPALYSIYKLYAGSSQDS